MLLGNTQTVCDSCRNAGAGLDTRPWRLHLGHDITWFEVDLPDMTAFKRDSMERAGLAAETPADCNAGVLTCPCCLGDMHTQPGSTMLP